MEDIYETARKDLGNLLENLQKEIQQPFPNLDGNLTKAYSLIRTLKQKEYDISKEEAILREVQYQIDLWS